MKNNSIEDIVYRDIFQLPRGCSVLPILIIILIWILTK
jgi:hypothetical protein